MINLLTISTPAAATAAVLGAGTGAWAAAYVRRKTRTRPRIWIWRLSTVAIFLLQAFAMLLIFGATAWLKHGPADEAALAVFYAQVNLVLVYTLAADFVLIGLMIYAATSRSWGD